ncbi:MAG: spore maturation protein A [Clostridia bacterium]|nr:spore maturation protein A [Clostridia bacterium]
MLNWIWSGMILCSLVYGACTGGLEQTIGGCFSGTEEAVTLVLSMAGILSFWSGLLKVAQAGGVLSLLERGLAPVTKRLLPGIPEGSEAMNKVCANIAANLFGLGNAATPFGIAAIKSMKKYAAGEGIASDDMCTFVVLNTASIQLVPSTVIAMRAGLGSAAPASLIPLCWLSSGAALGAGLFCAGLMKRRKG